MGQQEGRPSALTLQHLCSHALQQRGEAACLLKRPALAMRMRQSGWSLLTRESTC